jgi:uncharacterized protein (TIRG00374 family)
MKDTLMQLSRRTQELARQSQLCGERVARMRRGCPDTGERFSEGKNRAYFWTAGGIAGFAVLLAMMALSRDIDDVWEYFRRIDAKLLMIMLSLSVFNYLTRVIRWQYFNRRLGLILSLRRNGLYYVAGFSMTITPGKVGEALRIWLLRRSHAIPYDRSVGLLIADRLSDAGALLLICMIGALGFDHGFSQALTLANIGVVLIGLTWLFFKPSALIEMIGWLYGRVRRAPKRFARLRRSFRQLARLGSWRVYGGTLVLATLGWSAEAFALHQLMIAFDSPLPLAPIMFMFGASLLIGVAAMLPGGLGGTEISMVGMLVSMGVDMDAAVAATAVIRLTTLWFSVLLGFIALPLALWSAGRQSDARDVDRIRARQSSFPGSDILADFPPIICNQGKR